MKKYIPDPIVFQALVDCIVLWGIYQKSLFLPKKKKKAHNVHSITLRATELAESFYD